MSTLEKLRKDKGMTQSTLAKSLGVDQSAVCLWEKGKTLPRVDVAIRLANLLGCTLDDIYRRNDPCEANNASTS